MRSFLFLLLTVCVPAIYASEKSLLVATYNVENLFDTVNHPFIQDDILSAEQYQLKVKNIARVIGELEPDLLVLCEVENAEVVEDVVREVGTPAYRVVHYDSPDPRGMDVAMVYRPDRLQVLNSEPIAAPDGYRTRDVLRVEAVPVGETSHRHFVFYGLHLPSRRGGRTLPTRMRTLIATDLNNRVLDEDSSACVVVLGDLNDNPNSKLVTTHFSALYCSTTEPFRRGAASYAWRDNWLMYDNILLRPGDSSAALAASVFIRPWLLTPEGRFRGYPRRGAFSDHLPVYLRIAY